MKEIPFKMIVETKMEQYRKDSFWEKEPETIAWIDSFADNAVLFDVGSNIGVYALYCAAIHPGSRVLAFEPHEKNFNRLLDNVILNGFQDRIKPHQAIISSETGMKGFTGYSEEIGSSGGQMSEPTNNAYNCRSIDDMVYFSFDTPQPNHIKIDIDGQEWKVIQGMEKTLKNQQLKSVLVEINQDREKIISAFESTGFTMNNWFNKRLHHSRVRRAKEGIDAENVIFTRRI